MYMNNHITCVFKYIISINGLNIFMVTLINLYLIILKFYVRYLLNIVCQYYRVIQTILLNLFKLFKLLFIDNIYYM
jgi:hypothetical protein